MYGVPDLVILSERQMMTDFSFEAVDAQDYARLRPTYAPEAIRWLVQRVALNGSSHVLDLGAGPGPLARRFLELGVPVMGVEPASNMRDLLAEVIGPEHALEGTAEAIPLPTSVIDLIVAGQAVHWFEPKEAIPEIDRVLKSTGALAWLRTGFSSGQAPDVLAEIVKRHEPHGWFDQHSRPEWGHELEKSGLFTAPEVRTFLWCHSLPASQMPAWVATWGDVAALPSAVRVPLLAEIEAVVGTFPSVVTFDTSTQVRLTFRRQRSLRGLVDGVRRARASLARGIGNRHR